MYTRIVVNRKGKTKIISKSLKKCKKIFEMENLEKV
jgi:hypothetical protein